MQQTSQLQFGFCVSLNICVYSLVNVLLSYNTVLFIFKAKVKEFFGKYVKQFTMSCAEIVL